VKKIDGTGLIEEKIFENMPKSEKKIKKILKLYNLYKCKKRRSKFCNG
jgi:hypothetical protein